MVYRQTPRSEKIRSASRARILASARKLFLKRGYEATTMQDVVREAGTSIGNAYFYFGNKEELLMILVEDALRASWVRFDPIIASIEIGAARIAMAVYGQLMTFLVFEKELFAAGVADAPRVVRRATEMSWDRLVGLFKANFPEADEKQLRMAAVAVGGADRIAVEFALAGVLNVPAKELVDFLVRWHLRALGLPEREISRVLRAGARMAKAKRVK
jgi:AcrR family transcriptional regulator